MKISNKILFFVLAIFAISFSCYIGYQSGYSHGERDGYSDGEREAWSYYPQMSTDSIIIEKGGGIISINGITIIGEKSILELIEGKTASLFSWD